MSAERSTLEEVARWSQSEGSQLAHTPSRPSAATPMSSGASSKSGNVQTKNIHPVF